MPSPYPPRWNIFARELERVLDDHDLRLGQLDDRGVVLQREKVRRLQHSLRSPAHFPTLNPEEVERLFTIVELTSDEQARIRAALLATAVERILMDRLDPPTALMAADDVFNILYAALRAQPVGVLAGIKGGSPADEADETGDTAYEEALDLIDRATLALHLSREAKTPEARKTHAEEAAETFTRAKRLLQTAQLPAHESDEWRGWDQEVAAGLASANALLAQPGGGQP